MDEVQSTGMRLLVRLDEDLDRSRLVGIWYAIRLIPGVQSIARLDAISRETLDVLLRPSEPKHEARR
jgi:hypothetical protein